MNSEPTAAAAEGAPPPSARSETVAPHTSAEIDSYVNSLLAMARAVQSVGMYGVTHPAAQEAVAEWVHGVGPLLRSHGRLVLHSDGRVASVNGAPVSTSNPVVLSLLRKLHTTRAGKIELLSGFHTDAAGLIAEFLAGADATRLADTEHSFGTWIEHHRVRHVRVSALRLRELKEDDRVVSVERKPPASRVKPSSAPAPAPLKAEELAAWARDFQQEADRAGQPAPLPRKLQDIIVTYLRGSAEVQPASLAEHMTRAAHNPGHFSELILKVALVQQELAQSSEKPVGDDVVNCLRSVLDVLQQAPDARTEEGCHNLARTLAVLETHILERLHALAGGTEDDAQIVRAGIRTLQHDLEGAALKCDYEQKRSALLAVEQKIRRFFGLESGAASGAPG